MKPIVKRATAKPVQQRALKRMNVAFDGGKKRSCESRQPEARVETTEEELQGFMIIRAIAAEVAPVSRIVMRDAQSYCAVLFDDNNPQADCLLHASTGRASS